MSYWAAETHTHIICIIQLLYFYHILYSFNLAMFYIIQLYYIYYIYIIQVPICHSQRCRTIASCRFQARLASPLLQRSAFHQCKDHQYGLMVYKSIFQEISILLNIVIYLVSIPHCENQLYSYFRKPPFGRVNPAVPSMFQQTKNTRFGTTRRLASNHC